jgi:hypothetical protein
MYYDEYNDYTKEYRPGVSRISRTKHHLRLDENFSLITNRYSGNYILHFSRKGVLTSFTEFEFDKDNKISGAIRYVYTYTKHQYIALIIAHDLITHMLNRKIEFNYNADNQITEEYVTEYLHTGEIFQEIECTHQYKDNYHKMRHYNSYDEVEHFFETWYDADAGSVEFKLSEHDGSISDWTKSIYNKSGHLIRECRLNEKGTVSDESEYFYLPKKQVQICYGTQQDVFETLIENDHKHIWKTKSHFKNGELYCVEEQTIEYY